MTKKTPIQIKKDRAELLFQDIEDNIKDWGSSEDPLKKTASKNEKT